jgi:hypothetical protein
LALVGAIPADAAGVGGHTPSSTSSVVTKNSSSSASAILGPLAGLLGSLPGTHSLPTTAWPGYWLASTAGGVGSYGGTPFDGSLSKTILRAPVVGMAATPDGRGYWLVAADGGVFSFGDAPFYGSIGGRSLDQPVVGMAATPDGRGYWLVAADGGVFSFGDAPFRGSASGDVPTGESITAMFSGPGTDSTVDVTGDFTSPVIAQVVSTNPPYPHGASGYDISYPQCQKTYPPRSAVAVVGANDGSAFTSNPCFTSEADWAGPNLTVYLNLNSPKGSNSAQWARGGDGTCATGDAYCESFNYGFNTAQSSIAFVRSAGYSPRTWWLDVETGNYWSSDTLTNDQVIAGALAAIHLAGNAAAIYSTDYQWGQIAGNYVPNVPAWYATGVATFSPQSWCSGTSFAGGPVYLVQGKTGSYDGAYSC